MYLLSFEKEKLLEDLDLPKHIEGIELGDLMIYCLVCAEGKFICSYRQDYKLIKHPNLTDNDQFREIAIEDEFQIEIDKETKRVSEFFCNKMSKFVDAHRNCVPLSENDMSKHLGYLF